jgi:hypothetical protein
MRQAWPSEVDLGDRRSGTFEHVRNVVEQCSEQIRTVLGVAPVSHRRTRSVLFDSDPLLGRKVLMTARKRPIQLLFVVLLCLMLGNAATGTAAAVPIDYELDDAYGGTPPDEIVCTDVDPDWGGMGCWEPYGDIPWVLSYTPGATVWWWNYYPTNSTLYRQGKCRFQFYDWGYCNKNMHEGSKISFQICDHWDADLRTRCSPVKSTTT